jgi:adenylylsulfate kinase-like enzyme
VSPYAKDRETVWALLPDGAFSEVHVSAPVDVLKARDVKGLYGRAAQGEAIALSGIAAPYEVPERPEMSIDSSVRSVESSVEMLLNWIAAVAPRTPQD